MLKKYLFSIIFCVFAGMAFALPINEMPMYGGQHDPQVESNEWASKEASKLGWKYYSQGDMTTAIKRFNQAWMFDRSNPEAYWGFGLIMGQRFFDNNSEESLRESVRFLKMAAEISPKNGKIIGDLAYSYTVLGGFLASNKKGGNSEMEEAEILFTHAVEFEPSSPSIYANWSILKFMNGDYLAAKRLLDKAIEIGYKPNPDYLKDLADKLK